MSLRPHSNLIWLASAWLFSALLPIFWPETRQAWWGCSAAAWLIVAIDAWRSRHSVDGECLRELDGSLAVNRWHTVHLKLRLLSGKPQTVQVTELYPEQLQVKGLPQTLDISAERWSICEYQIKPMQRGDLSLGPSQLLISSPGGWWQRRLAVCPAETTRVYPDFAALNRYAIAAQQQSITQLGVRRRRRRGEGQEFHQLRDFRDGDSLRQIDWKATSRMQRVIARDYQEERDQPLLFALDSSRRMRSEADGLAHFDHALNASLLLSYVALRQGDSAGLLCFGGQSRYLAPRKGSNTIRQLLNASYDLQPTLAAADYDELTEQLLSKQQRRALVVILTNLQDDNDDRLLQATRLLQKRHVVMIANLHENAINDLAKAKVGSHEDALNHCMALDWLNRRRRLEQAAANAGARMISVSPAELPMALINGYYAVKRSGLL